MKRTKRRQRTAVRIEVRNPGEAWRLAAQAADITVAYQAARECVNESNDSTDISGDPVTVRRWFFVRVVRSGHIVWAWRSGQLLEQNDIADSMLSDSHVRNDTRRATCAPRRFDGEHSREGRASR